MCFVFLPRFIYNSDRVRDILKFIKTVVYPITVVFIPFALATGNLAGVVTKKILKRVANDFILRFLYENADDAWDFLVAHMENFPQISRLLTRL